MEAPGAKTNAAVSAGGKPIPSPLAEVYASAGARMGEWFGCALPDDFGDPVAEYRFSNQTVALEDKNYRTYLKFAGPDRVRYLNAILTNNIKDLAPGQGTISLLLNPQGHILAELETYAFADHHLCVSYSMIREQLIQWMDKYIIMDDVTLTDATDRWGTLALEGPKAAAVVKELASVDLQSLGELASVDSVVKAIHCRIVKRSPGGVPGAEFVVERTHLSALWQILLEAVRKHSGGPAGYTALSGQRLSQGVAWFSYDFGEKQIPHEAGLENTHISYTKGCYTGQEIVERVRSRGHVNRRRVGLLFSGDSVPEPGTVLTMDGPEVSGSAPGRSAPDNSTPNGTEVGHVTRAARVWDPPRIIGMGYLRKEAEGHGTTLHWPGGTATVIHLP